MTSRETVDQIIKDARATDYRGDFLYPEAVLAARIDAVVEAVYDDRFNRYIEGLIAQARR